MQTISSLYSLKYDDTKTYLMASLFIIGNVLLPQLFHIMPQGGVTWLPIYFFTLIGSYKYGWRVGLLTALASPVVNSLLFGMPVVACLPVILLKSVLLAIMAGYVSNRFNRASFALLISVVLGYQVIGTLGEWMINGNLYATLQDFRIGVPGMLMQVFGGWIFINKFIKK